MIRLRRISVMALAAAAIVAPLLVSGPASPASATTHTSPAAAATSPDRVSGGMLSGVSCVSPTFCVAVGESAYFDAIAQQFNGKGWGPMVLPGTPAGFLASVSCLSPTFCMAVGGRSEGKASVPLQLVWNGSVWRDVSTTGIPGEYSTWFNGVSCVTATDCQAIGDATVAAAGSSGVFGARWNGSGWTLQQAANPSYDQAMLSVSCSATVCLAVGEEAIYLNGKSAWGPFVERRDGSQWVQVSSPSVGAGALLTGVSCVGTNWCMAAGALSAGGDISEVWNGASMRLLSTPTPPHTYGSSYNGVSCTATNYCMAIGSDSPASNQNIGHLVAARWNGAAWSLLPIPNYPSAPSDNVNAVSCFSGNSCYSVGYSGATVYGSDAGFKTLQMWWTGTAWTATPDIVAIVPTSNGGGYYLADSDGAVYPYGAAVSYGDMAGKGLTAPIVAMALDPATGGYWLLGADGGVFTFHAHFYGSEGGAHLNKPIVAMEATPDGYGYRFVASDGGIFDFGDAHYYGSMGGSHLNQPIVGMTDDPATGGYWMVAADGGIFSFRVRFFGSTGNIHLNEPIIEMEALPDGSGYRFTAGDGGVFDFGSAKFKGSLGGASPAVPVTGMAAWPLSSGPYTDGYWLVEANGTVTGFTAPTY